MVSDVWRIVAGSTKTGDDRPLENVILSGHSSDGNLKSVEKVFAPSHGASRIGIFIIAAVFDEFPSAVNVEDVGRKGRTRWIQAERIVDANKEFLFGKMMGASLGAVIV